LLNLIADNAAMYNIFLAYRFPIFFIEPLFFTHAFWSFPYLSIAPSNQCFHVLLFTLHPLHIFLVFSYPQLISFLVQDI
jgi:hypothetical protein